ncbi:hypothetical protein BD408DRAFT_428521 [Parasitella parasitica]|nr:hypothetical protein BD408DRAFT_428521 [Parasitella parasitica]
MDAHNRSSLTMGLISPPKKQGRARKSNTEVHFEKIRLGVRHGLGCANAGSAVCHENDDQDRWSIFTLHSDVWPTSSLHALENEDLLHYEDETDEEAVLQRITELVRLNRNVIPEAVDKINVYKVKMKAHYDKTAQSKNYKVHDKVMVCDHTLVRDGQTLVPRWLGPFMIKEKKAKDTYILQDQFLTLPHPYHADQLKLYRARPNIYLPLHINRGRVQVNGG